MSSNRSCTSYCPSFKKTSKSSRRGHLPYAPNVTLVSLLLSFPRCRQADLLLERLLVRLAGAELLHTKQSLAYCISELTVSEKGLKKLLEQMKNIRLALQDSVVFDFFRVLLSKAKKSKSSAAATANGAAGAEEAGESKESGTNAAAKGAANGAVGGAVTKATIEEVEKALLAAVQGGSNSESTANEDGEVVECDNIDETELNQSRGKL